MVPPIRRVLHADVVRIQASQRGVTFAAFPRLIHIELIKQIERYESLFQDDALSDEIILIRNALPGAAACMSLLLGHMIASAVQAGDMGLAPNANHDRIYAALRTVASLKELPVDRVEYTLVHLVDMFRVIQVSNTITQLEVVTKFIDNVDDANAAIELVRNVLGWIPGGNQQRSVQTAKADYEVFVRFKEQKNSLPSVALATKGQGCQLALTAIEQRGNLIYHYGSFSMDQEEDTIINRIRWYYIHETVRAMDGNYIALSIRRTDNAFEEYYRPHFVREADTMLGTSSIIYTEEKSLRLLKFYDATYGPHFVKDLTVDHSGVTGALIVTEDKNETKDIDDTKKKDNNSSTGYQAQTTQTAKPGTERDDGKAEKQEPPANKTDKTSSNV